MSDHLRPPPTSSVGRSQPIFRPDWPWAARTYSQGSPQRSPFSSGSVLGSNLQSGWDPRASVTSNSSQSGYPGTNNSTPKPLRSTMGHARESTRQWTFMGFEWDVRDVHKLRDFVEGVEPQDDDNNFEILKQSPVLGDNKFKLEIAPPVEGASSPSPTTLSIYITSLLDFPQGDYETCASLMAAIKCQDDRVGERGVRPEWIWEFWQNDWVFRRESEVWECPLPALSALLKNPRIQDSDSFVICVQIHCPVGPFIPQQPSAYYVPRDLLDGLEASLDNPNTGDVRFVCLERRLNSEPSSGSTSNPSNQSTVSLSSSVSQFGSYTSARKRVIYAHSDILIRRSDYFATMLASSFAENSAISTGERKLYTIVVEDADFETIYWLLKYCYANWLLFKHNDDPRSAVEGVGAGWSAKWLNGQQGEWDWKTFHKGGSEDGGGTDTRSATSADSIPPSSAVSGSTSNSDVYNQNTVSRVSPNITSTGTRTTPSKSTINSSSTPRQTNPTSSRRAAPSASSNPVTMSTSGSLSNIPKAKHISIATQSNNLPAATHYPVSPRSSRHPGNTSSPPSDPHPHPTPTPGPASALSMYQVAHRYAMPNLASLSLEYIMSTITPKSSFALLLATSVWEELYTLIEDFVVDRWDEVSLSEEFEHCCKEVAAGEWGPDGGKTLMSVFRRLRSPTV